MALSQADPATVPQDHLAVIRNIKPDLYCFLLNRNRDGDEFTLDRNVPRQLNDNGKTSKSLTAIMDAGCNWQSHTNNRLS
jgi:hypothetical protein